MSSHRFIIKCWELMSDLIFMSFRLVILDEFNIHSDIPLRSPDMKIYVCARGFFLPIYSCKGHILDPGSFLECIL